MIKKFFFTTSFCVMSSIIFGQTQIGNDINGEAINDYFGTSVSVSSDGNTIAVGANGNDGNGVDSGSVRIYTNISGTWTKIGDDIDGEAAGDYSGFSISISGDGSIVAIGANGNDGNGNASGSVRVYENISGTWVKIGADIDGEAAGDFNGSSVSLSNDGSVLAIGARYNDGGGTDSGSVRVYMNVSGTWTKIGADIDGEAAGDFSGHSVSLSEDGTIVAIGAYLNDGSGTDSGSARVYKNISGTWTKIGDDIDGEAAGDFSGHSVNISDDGNVVVIGAINNDGNGANSGSARVYMNISGTWTKIGDDIDGEASGDTFGRSVAISNNGNIIAIGAYFNDGNGNNAGSVRVYENTSGTWIKKGADIDGEVANDYSGNNISLSDNGAVLIIGAVGNDGNGLESGHVRVYDLSAVLSSNSFIQSNFSVYPNPTSETLTIELENNLILEKVNIYNTLGQVIKTESNTNIDVSKLQKGTYFVELITNQGKAIKSIIVN